MHKTDNSTLYGYALSRKTGEAMTITVYPANSRFSTNIDWLDSKHSFSFGEHYDPDRMGFGALRVLNDDRIEGKTGFGKHPHEDMEIVTVVLEGAVAHSDSMGNSGSIPAGDVQRMSAGTGVWHSEKNETDGPLHLLQIWIEPAKKGLRPDYEQRTFDVDSRRDELVPLVGAGGGLHINQDAAILRGMITGGKSVTHAVALGHGAFVFVMDGVVHVDEHQLRRGDSAAIEDADTVKITAESDSDILVIDVPMDSEVI